MPEKEYIEREAIISILNAKADMACGTPKEVFSEKERLTAIGLSVPQSTLLLHELKERGIGIKSDAVTIEECVCDIVSYFRERGRLND